ncbi:MAG: response regulator transcription factor [Acidobacteria bacterium]|nr:response regulator transcription factor [Acidobacteriota bacterium]
MGDTILIIDDDVNLNDLVTTYLSGFDYGVESCSDPTTAVDQIKTKDFQLIILDVMMPGMDGFTVLRKIRDISRVPVIMLTACGELTDRVVGLELGADDYLAKPFEPRELLARIRSVLRRFQNAGQAARLVPETKEHGLALQPEKKQARLDGQPLDLTSMEFDFLELMMANKGRVLSRDYIMDRLKGYEWEAYDRSIDILVSRVRSKLGDSPADPIFIKTVRGAGYMFIG